MPQPFTFRINTEKNIPAVLPRQFVDEMTVLVNVSEAVTSDETYTDFLTGITRIIEKYASQLSAETPIYHQRLALIGHHEQTIPVPAWGGVSFREASESRDYVEKFLIVKQAVDPFGVLGFEYHNKKIEKLQLEEGLAIFMKAETPGKVTLTFAGPGDTCELPPPIAHGVIPLTNTAILETSNYELGADDLLYIFQPAAIS